MEKQQQINLINKAWKNIDYVLSCQSNGQYGKQYLNLNRQEEKQHDKGRPITIKRGLTINEASKLFAVRDIVKFLNDENYSVKLKDYIFYRQSVFFAYSLVLNYKEELKEALKEIDYNQILKINYAELIK